MRDHFRNIGGVNARVWLATWSILNWYATLYVWLIARP